MGTFVEQQGSREQHRVIELYQFTYGPTTIRYTNYEQDVTYNSVTWTSLTITRSNPEISKDRPRTRLTVKLPQASTIGRLYVTPSPSYQMSVRVLRYDPGASPPDSAVVFDGYVASASYQDNGYVCELQLSPFNEIFNRQVPRFTYQGLCNHVLYDGGCKVNRNTFKYTGTVVSTQLNETVIEVAGVGAAGGSSPQRDWVGGYVELPDGSDSRQILDQEADNLTLLLPFYDPVAGAEVNVYRGCDHTLTTCKAVFNNVLNYGGFPYVPTVNPFQLSQFTREE
jgi:uncharacterized phage protein (TIGR02218 family)